MSESDGPETTDERRVLRRKRARWSLLARIEEENERIESSPQDSPVGRDRAAQHFCVEWTAASLVFWILGAAVTGALGWIPIMTKVIIDAITGFVLVNLLQRPMPEA